MDYVIDYNGKQYYVDVERLVVINTKDAKDKIAFKDLPLEYGMIINNLMIQYYTPKV
jgi:hypothetical protein